MHVKVTEKMKARPAPRITVYGMHYIDKPARYQRLAMLVRYQYPKKTTHVAIDLKIEG